MRSLFYPVVPALLLMIIVAIAPLSVEAKTFETKSVEEGNYTFEYPNNWKTEKLNRFSGLDARIVYGNNDAQMNFQSGDPIDYLIFDVNSSELSLTSLEEMAESLYEGTVFESNGDKYMVNGYPAPYTLVTFEKDAIFSDLQMVGMVVMVTLNPDQVVIVQYLAEQDDFDKYLPKVEKIFQSIRALDSGGNTQAETNNSFTSQENDLSKTKAICDTVTNQSGRDLCETLLN
ncbi:MAG: hypothetical protein M3P28_04205 [Thermoproteota archaeon]|nr:hypothetical protein [Thermoproteota archaeon]